MRRHELSDAQWELNAVLVYRAGRYGGGRRRDHRQVVNGLMWKLCTGAEWRDLPERYGPWQTVYERRARWHREGLFDTILDRLRLKLNAEGLIDLELWCIDSTSVRASRSAAGARTKGIRRSRTTTRSASLRASTAARLSGEQWPGCRSALRSRPGSGTQCRPSSKP
jgi:transposase